MESKSKKIVPLRIPDKNVNIGPISKKNIFLEWEWKTKLNGPIKSLTFEKKFEREFFGGGIPSFLENSYLECEENVRTFPSSFRLVRYNVAGMWRECEPKWRHLMCSHWDSQ